VYYPMQRLTDAEMHAAGANPTAEEYRTQIIPTFNHINNTDIAQLADADLPCAGGHPTAIEVNTGFLNLLRRINSSVDAPAIDDPASIPASTSDELRIHANDAIRSINDTIVSKTHFTERYNKGFAERKNLLFNQTVPDANAGRFLFRIPLSFIFNFCEDYDKVV